MLSASCRNQSSATTAAAEDVTTAYVILLMFQKYFLDLIDASGEETIINNLFFL